VKVVEVNTFSTRVWDRPQYLSVRDFPVNCSISAASVEGLRSDYNRYHQLLQVDLLLLAFRFLVWGEALGQPVSPAE